MKEIIKQPIELTRDVHFSSYLDAVAAAWEAAWQAFKNDAGKEQRDGYIAATDSLGHAIAAFQSARPGLIPI